MAKILAARRHGPDDSENMTRGRILEAAFAAFMKKGYAATSTEEIATRARVSKRELYALVGNKHTLLAACIGERARRLQMPTDLPAPHDRESLARLLNAFGGRLLREISEPAVIAVFRLAIAEAMQTPDVAKTLDTIGRGAARTALRTVMAQAREAGLIEGDPILCAEQFSGLLWGTLMVGLLLGVEKQPAASDIAARAGDATAAFLILHPARNTAKS